MASIEKRTFTIRIGNDFQQLLQFKKNDLPMDLADYSFKMQIRKCKNSSTEIYTLESPTQIDISDAANGNIILKITDTVTATFSEMNAVFDLQWTTDAGIKDIVLEGNIQILETVTK